MGLGGKEIMSSEIRKKKCVPKQTDRSSQFQSNLLKLWKRCMMCLYHMNFLPGLDVSNKDIFNYLMILFID